LSTYAVILCGGRGERFWPKSRRQNPKQFIRLFGKRSLTQETSDRVLALCPMRRQVFVAPAEFGPILRRQLGKSARLVFEPVGRNTAPAIGLAAVYLRELDPEATMVVLPADHEIEDRAAFVRSLRLAVQMAGKGMLVTFGIPPGRPDTGYGYIQLGATLAGKGKLTAHRVRAFREKPDAATARRYLAEGDFAWNSGMFVWRVDAILDAFRRLTPELHALLEGFAPAIGTRSEKRALAAMYQQAQTVSIDYAVMEKAENVCCVRGEFDWDDVGSWLALARHLKLDPAGNAGNGLYVARDAGGCVFDTDAGIIAALGVKDLVVVRSGDAVLVASKDRLDSIKALLADIGANPHTKRHL
jgi:mannose-1-phosphate guanylyltransferase